MERETWDSLLSFLLAINDALLAPPAVKDDVGDQLCERVILPHFITLMAKSIRFKTDSHIYIFFYFKLSTFFN